MKKTDTNLIKKRARSAAVSSVLGELIARIEEGQRTAIAKSKNFSFIQRAVSKIQKENETNLTAAFKKLTKDGRHDLRKGAKASLEISLASNRRAVQRLHITEMAPSLIGETL